MLGFALLEASIAEIQIKKFKETINISMMEDFLNGGKDCENAGKLTRSGAILWQ